MAVRKPLVNVAGEVSELPTADSISVGWAWITGAPATATRWPSWTEVTDKPTTFAPSAHTHPISDVTNLQTSLDGKANLTGAAFTGLTSHALGTLVAGSHGRFQGGDASPAGASGIGVELFSDGTNAVVQGFNRTTSTFTPLRFGSASTFSGLTTHNAGIVVPSSQKVIVRDNNNTLNNLELGGGYNNATDGNAFIANRFASGFIELYAANGGHRLRVGSATNLTYNDQAVWHAGNFTPSNYALSSHTHPISDITNLQASLDGKQANLGFTPVRQGGGAGQLGNTVYIGWTGSKTKIQIDTTDMGNIAMEGWVNSNYAGVGGGNAFGTWPISITGNAASANVWTTGRSFTIGSTAKTVNGGGNVGWTHGEIGVVPSTGGTFSGQVNATDFANTSDIKFKTDIKPLRSGARLNPVHFTWIEDSRADIGFVAQQVEEVWPELVSVVEGQDGDHHKAVNYAKITAVLAKQLYEALDRIDELERRLSAKEPD